MTDKITGAMQKFGFGADADDPAAGPNAGLVLLYSDAWMALPACWPLAKRTTVIGRDATDIVLEVSAVSRRHAELSFERGAWLIRDLKSKNGTLVDGRAVEEVVLEEGSEIRIGDCVLKFVERGAELYAEYRIDGSMVRGAERRSKTPSALVGGYQMDRVAAEIERIAPSELTVMLLGESGTGKEVLASEIHRLSGRRGSFCAVNCAAIPASLIESELFGYKRGAFSGADRDKPGLIRTAQGGTLLLDEIGDMPLDAQAKLLRVIQSKEVYPLGATAPERVDVRVVCATHRDLLRLQQVGTFRPDLFARLNEYQLKLRPLRDRKEDVFMLVRAFLERHGRPDLHPSFAFMLGLLNYDWPYNVRELEAAIKRCVAIAEESVLDEEQLPEAVRDAMADYAKPAGALRTAPPTQPAVPSAVRSPVPTDVELRALLERHGGNVAAVGRELGKARMQIHRWMKRYGIEVDEFRDE